MNNPIGHNNPPDEMQILKDKLVERNREAIETARGLVEKADAYTGEITNDQEAGVVSDYIKEINTSRKRMDDTRTVEKKPFLDSGRTVDGFFNAEIQSLDVAKAKANKPLTDWLQKKAAEERRKQEDAARLLREEAERKAEEARKLEQVGLTEHANVAMAQATKTENKAERLEAVKPASLGVARGTGGGVASLRMRWVGEITDRNAIDLETLRPYLAQAAIQVALNAFVAAGGRELKGAKIEEKAAAGVR